VGVAEDSVVVVPVAVVAVDDEGVAPATGDADAAGDGDSDGNGVGVGDTFGSAPNFMLLLTRLMSGSRSVMAPAPKAT
jgi:hypothetical protein